MSMRDREKPVRTKTNTVYADTTETHPAYALIGASRVSSTPGATLFNSDFRHQHYIVVTIRRAEMSRGLNNDHAFGRDQLIEVALSESQWGEFLSTFNMGQGVPCTLQWFDGYIPAIDQDLDRRSQFREEVETHFKEGMDVLDEVLASTSLRKADREKLERVKAHLVSRLDWAAKQFDEHTEKTVAKAKAELASYIARLREGGQLREIGEGPVLELIEPGE